MFNQVCNSEIATQSYNTLLHCVSNSMPNAKSNYQFGLQNTAVVALCDQSKFSHSLKVTLQFHPSI